jgi:uncharacterized membrane protein
VLSLIGTVIYATVLSLIGYEVGHAWGSINHGLTIATYILVAIVVIAIAGFVVYRLRQFRREAAQQRDSAQHRGSAQQPDSARSGGTEPRDPSESAAPRRPGKHRSDAEV